jgi:WhiB family redox-sensing transcriptional regulator
VNPVVEWMMSSDTQDIEAQLAAFIGRPAWMARAACKGEPPGTFFLELGDPTGYVRARELCGRCEVRTECLAHALADPEDIGFFAGMTPVERRAMRPKRGYRRVA